MIYFYIDGDDVGLRLEHSLLTNDEETLTQINSEVTSTIIRLTESLERRRCEIIFSGADGVIGKTHPENVDAVHDSVRSLVGSLTFSIGVGGCLRDAFAALRFAKANGKNGLAYLDSDFHWKSNSSIVKEGGTIACTGVRESAAFKIDNLSRVPGDA